jgi:RimJ/RimL family protein N-acetyltransferase
MTTTATFEGISWPTLTERLLIRPATTDDRRRLFEIRPAPGVSHRGDDRDADRAARRPGPASPRAGWLDGGGAAVLAEEWGTETPLTAGQVARLAGPVTLDRVSWPLKTARLTIRPATAQDLAAVFAYRSLPDVGRWMPHQPEEFAAWLLQLDGTAMLERTLVMEADGEVVGDLYLHIEDAWAQREVQDRAKQSQAEIGWALSPEHQGHGYAAEGVAELVRACFEELGLRRLTAVAFADNEASLRLMEKIGMQREALYRRESLHRELGWVDSVVYALLREDWTG